MRCRAISIAALFVAALSLAGCLIIPTDYYTAYSRKNVGEEPPATVVPGKTTREEVLVGLGEPDRVSEDETEFWYVASKIKGIIIVGDRGGEILMNYIQTIRFDGNETVQTVKQFTTSDPDGDVSWDFGYVSPSRCEPHFSKSQPLAQKGKWD